MQKDKAYAFKEHILNKGIRVIEENTKYSDYSWKLDDNKALEHLRIMVELQKALAGYTGSIGNRLPNCIGEQIEESKVQVRRLKRDINNLKKYAPMNKFEEILLNKGEYFLERAEASIALARASKYMDRIYRSMRANEICIGDVTPGNIGKEERLFIRDISRCNYNLIEFDAIYFFSKAKRKGSSVNFRELSREFIQEQHLEGDSEDFIMAMVNYPYEFMKACSRYRSLKKNWSEEEYAENLIESMIKDGEEV